MGARLRCDGSGLTMRKDTYTVTLKRAAEMLQVTPDTLRQQIRRGVLHAEKLGRDWFVTIAEVERYAAEHRRTREDAR